MEVLKYLSRNVCESTPQNQGKKINLISNIIEWTIAVWRKILRW